MADLLFFAGVVVLVIIIAVIAYLYYCGLFHRVEISTGAPFIQKATVMYKFQQGPYENSGHLFCRITKLAPKAKCVGIYYDNPDNVSADKLRYAAGAVLAENNAKPDSDIQKNMEAEGFKLFEMPVAKNYIRGTFPFVNTLSLFLAYKRVYPKIMSYIKEHKLTLKVMVEVYADNMILFMGPQDHQDEFFVPEAKEAETDEHRNQHDK